MKREIKADLDCLSSYLGMMSTSKYALESLSRIRAELVESAPSASDNSRYTIALSVLGEFIKWLKDDPTRECAFDSYCHKRINGVF